MLAKEPLGAVPDCHLRKGETKYTWQVRGPAGWPGKGGVKNENFPLTRRSAQDASFGCIKHGPEGGLNWNG